MCLTANKVCGGTQNNPGTCLVAVLSIITGLLIIYFGILRNEAERTTTLDFSTFVYHLLRVLIISIAATFFFCGIFIFLSLLCRLACIRVIAHILSIAVQTSLAVAASIILSCYFLSHCIINGSLVSFGIAAIIFFCVWSALLALLYGFSSEVYQDTCMPCCEWGPIGNLSDVCFTNKFLSFLAPYIAQNGTALKRDDKCDQIIISKNKPCFSGREGKKLKQEIISKNIVNSLRETCCRQGGLSQQTTCETVIQEDYIFDPSKTPAISHLNSESDAVSQIVCESGGTAHPSSCYQKPVTLNYHASSKETVSVTASSVIPTPTSSYLFSTAVKNINIKKFMIPGEKGHHEDWNNNQPEENVKYVLKKRMEQPRAKDLNVSHVVKDVNKLVARVKEDSPCSAIPQTKLCNSSVDSVFSVIPRTDTSESESKNLSKVYSLRFKCKQAKDLLTKKFFQSRFNKTQVQNVRNIKPTRTHSNSSDLESKANMNSQRKNFQKEKDMESASMKPKARKTLHRTDDSEDDYYNQTERYDKYEKSDRIRNENVEIEKSKRSRKSLASNCGFSSSNESVVIQACPPCPEPRSQSNVDQSDSQLSTQNLSGSESETNNETAPCPAPPPRLSNDLGDKKRYKEPSCTKSSDSVDNSSRIKKTCSCEDISSGSEERCEKKPKKDRRSCEKRPKKEKSKEKICRDKSGSREKSKRRKRQSCFGPEDVLESCEKFEKLLTECQGYLSDSQNRRLSQPSDISQCPSELNQPSCQDSSTAQIKECSSSSDSLRKCDSNIRKKERKPRQSCPKPKRSKSKVSKEKPCKPATCPKRNPKRSCSSSRTSVNKKNKCRPKERKPKRSPCDAGKTKPCKERKPKKPPCGSKPCPTKPMVQIIVHSDSEPCVDQERGKSKHNLKITLSSSSKESEPALCEQKLYRYEYA